MHSHHDADHGVARDRHRNGSDVAIVAATLPIQCYTYLHPHRNAQYFKIVRGSTERGLT